MAKDSIYMFYKKAALIESCIKEKKNDTHPTLAGFVHVLTFSLAGHAYIYIAKFGLFFQVDGNGLSQGMAVGNLPAVLLALIGTTTIVLACNPPPRD